MIVRLGFEVVGTEWAEVEIDDDEIEGMDEDDAAQYIQSHYCLEALRKAESNCNYSIADLEAVEFNDHEYWY